jgi:sarcosine oxidase gamma subunit
VTRLAFMSHPEGVPFASPLRNVEGIDDVSHLRKWEIRGDSSSFQPRDGAELIRISPDRALVVGERPDAERVYDMTAALAALEVEGEDLMRRLTELDLDELPAIGSILRGTPALIERRGGERFRLFVPQELGHFVAETIVDMAKGLGR